MKTVEQKYGTRPHQQLHAAVEEKRRPEQSFRAGAISASVWVNTTKEGDKEYRTVTFERRYQDKDGQWKSASSLRLNDLPRAAVVLAKAYEYLVLKGHEGQDINTVQEEVIA